ncbi:MAG: hypothetical protein WAX69_08845 [Victivallales bacterium]
MKKALIMSMLFWALVITAQAQQTKNYEFRALPAPTSTGSTSSPQAGSGQAGKVVIDGKLNEWDLSGGILCCYDTETLLETNSVQAYLMYDQQYLYAAFHFKDSSPMVNHVDPKLEPGSGWRSDSVQFRIWTDSDKPVGPGGSLISHLDCYYYTDENRPTARLMHYDISKKEAGLEMSLDEAVGKGVDAAFTKDPDGGGYIQEMRIAWELIRRKGQTFVAGETFRMGLEFFWGDASGKKWYKQRVSDLINKENPNREFFWQNNNAWGAVRLMEKGNVEKSPSIAQLEELKDSMAKKYLTKGPLKMEYETPADGYVTLVVEKADGTRVRNLFADYPRKSGKNVDFWDGLDDDGKLVEPGSYSFRGLWHPEFDVLYQFAYGNPGNPQWETPDGTGGWMSDCTPNAVATDGENLYFGGIYQECGVGTMALSGAGKKLWGLRAPEVIMQPALAADEKYLYLSSGRETGFGYEKGRKAHPDDMLLLERVDKKTGKPVPFEGSQRSFVELGLVKGLTGLPFETYGEIVEKNAFTSDVTMARVKGLAVGGGRIYVSSYFEDEIIVADIKTGKVLDRIKIPRPAGLAIDAGGKLIALSAKDKQVLRIDLQNKQATPVVTAKLEAPVGLTLDKDGNIYVSDWGKAMCVKVFSSDGKFLRTVGKEGGRPWIGKYDRNGMLLPWGIAVDKQDRLWVVEWDGSPRRVSVWKADGSFENEFVGAHWYAGTNCWIFPSEPEKAIGQGAEFELDWKKGQYRAISTFWRPMKKNAWFGIYPEFNGHQEITVNQRKLLVSHVGGLVMISERKGDQYQPLAAVGNVGSLAHGPLSIQGKTFAGLRLLRTPKLLADHLYWSPKINALIQERFPEALDGSFESCIRVIIPNLIEIINGSGAAGDLKEAVKTGKQYRGPTTEFVWSDKNGDGLVQDDEISFFEAPGVEPTGFCSGWTIGVASDLTIYPSATGGGFRVWKMPVSGWTDCGAPIYDGPKASLLINEPNTQTTSQSQWVDNKGNLFSNCTGTMKMYSPDGKVIWTYPNPYAGVHASHKSPKSERGMTVGGLYVIGSSNTKELGEVFSLNGNFGQSYLMTTDGLFVASVFRDTRSAPDDMPTKPVRGGSHASTTMDGEWFGGQFFRNPRDGKPYLVGEHHSAGGNCIYELTGLDQAKRLPAQTIAFTADVRAAAETAAAQAKAEAELAKAKETAQIREFPIRRMKAPADVDGKGTQFEKDGKWQAIFSKDDAHRAVATAAYDANNLYLFFQVKDESPLKNLAKFGMNELFKGGDCALFELGTGREAKDLSPKAKEGDIRLLLTRQNNENVAVLYRYVAPESKSPISITSGLGTLKIDEFQILKDAKIAAVPTADGYAIEAAIPLSAIGWKPEKGRSYRGDFGVVYSDKEGTKNSLRMHWATQNTGLVSDSFNEAQVQPAQWGIFKVE